MKRIIEDSVKIRRCNNLFKQISYFVCSFGEIYLQKTKGKGKTHFQSFYSD